MVTITNGEKTFRVTAGAVKPYESMGFHVASDEELEEMKMAAEEHYDDAGEPESSVKENASESESDANNEEEDVDTGMSKEDAAFIEELLEKPLSQWSNDEVKEFVKIKGIDTSGAQKVSQVRGIIKTYLEEQNKNA